MITSLVMAGSALASVIVPLTEKVMSVAVPAAAELAASMAARSEPAPESLRVDTVSDCVVSGRKPSCPRAAAALATAAGAAAMTAGAHTATPAAPAIRHRTPRGRDRPAGGRERADPLSVVAMDIVLPAS